MQGLTFRAILFDLGHLGFLFFDLLLRVIIKVVLRLPPTQINLNELLIILNNQMVKKYTKTFPEES